MIFNPTIMNDPFLNPQKTEVHLTDGLARIFGLMENQEMYKRLNRNEKEAFNKKTQNG
jgi:hypothetical protein